MQTALSKATNVLCLIEVHPPPPTSIKTLLLLLLKQLLLISTYAKM